MPNIQQSGARTLLVHALERGLYRKCEESSAPRYAEETGILSPFAPARDRTLFSIAPRVPSGSHCNRLSDSRFVLQIDLAILP